MKSRSQKREDALRRQQEAEARSPQDQLHRLNAKGLRATKERAKLMALILTQRVAV